MSGTTARVFCFPSAARRKCGCVIPEVVLEASSRSGARSQLPERSAGPLAERMRLKQAAVSAVEHRGDLLLCTISRQSGTSEDATLVRPQVAETTALGAAYAAGLAAGL